MHGESAAQNRCARKTVARREAAIAESGAEFDTIGSPFARGEASLDALCTEFEDNLAHHEESAKENFYLYTRKMQKVKIFSIYNHYFEDIAREQVYILDESYWWMYC
jgi:hypothetical protein